MKQRRGPPFLLVIVDEDNRTFTVEGPMVDDTRWNEAVGDARTAGRNVLCFIAHSHASAAAHANSQGLRFREPGAIVRPNTHSSQTRHQPKFQLSQESDSPASFLARSSHAVRLRRAMRVPPA